MDRRRALLAASQMEGGNGLEFPLYLYTNYCESFWMHETCVRDADEISANYYQYLWNMIFEHGVALNDIYIFLNESSLNSLGIEVYIDDEKIIELSAYKNNTAIEFTTNIGLGVWDISGKIEIDKEL